MMDKRLGGRAFGWCGRAFQDECDSSQGKGGEELGLR